MKLFANTQEFPIRLRFHEEGITEEMDDSEKEQYCFHLKTLDSSSSNPAYTGNDVTEAHQEWSTYRFKV